MYLGVGRLVRLLSIVVMVWGYLWSVACGPRIGPSTVELSYCGRISWHSPESCPWQSHHVPLVSEVLDGCTSHCSSPHLKIACGDQDSGGWGREGGGFGGLGGVGGWMGVTWLFGCHVVFWVSRGWLWCHVVGWVSRGFLVSRGCLGVT